MMINDNAALPEDVNPLLGYLGIRLVEWQPGRAEFAIDIEHRHLNRSGFLQGGVTATILDAACGR
jgi:acyl-coenzyme A thioesterase PaaI-like protein